MGKANMLLIPSAVPTGYAGEPRLPVQNPDYAGTYATRPVYGAPSMMLSAAVETTPHQARYAPHVDHQALNQFLQTVVSAQSPAIPTRGANRVKPGTRVVFKGPLFYNAVKAPSIDEVQTFMANRGPQPLG